jgi:hypothetical protein
MSSIQKTLIFTGLLLVVVGLIVSLIVYLFRR